MNAYLQSEAGKQYGWIFNSNLRTYSSKRNDMQQCNELINCITGYIVEMRLDLDVKELQYSRNGAK